MTEPTRNIFAQLPFDMTFEEVTDLLKAPGVRVERIVSRGHASPDDYWYDQDEGEWVMVVAGGARLRIEGERQDRTLLAGDWLYLAPHVRHRVTWTDPDHDTIWLAVFHPVAQ
ncbi:MAG: cupin domain-containing protein [Paracoccaceae bacterium]|nr:cupin domain-containing protein [Paracoccaceae bacterium]